MDDGGSSDGSSSPPGYRGLPAIPEYEYFSGEGEIDLATASHAELAFEWSMLCQDCTECWTGTGRSQEVNVTRAVKVKMSYIQ